MPSSAVITDRTTAADPPQSPRLEHLVAEHADGLMAYLVRWTHDRSLAEDVAQETWLRAWLNLDALVERRGSVRGWLTRVAHNIAVDHFRARGARPTEVELAPGVDAECLDAGRELSQVEDADVVAGVLRQARPTLRRTLAHVYLCDQTVPQAAASLGVPPGTVKSRLHYGLRDLRASGLAA